MNHYERLAVLREASRAVQESSDIAHALGMEDPKENAKCTGASKQCFAYALGHIDALIRICEKAIREGTDSTDSH